MSAYRLGLTGKAAEWAVQKQKQHRQVSQRAMMAIDAILNPAVPTSWWKVVIFLQNFLAYLKCRGKKIRVVVLNVFHYGDSESEVRLGQKIRVHKIQNWWALIARNCRVALGWAFSPHRIRSHHQVPSGSSPTLKGPVLDWWIGLERRGWRSYLIYIID